MLPTLIAALLALFNGANDNFKGVAPLYGSGMTTYRRALWWSTVATALGSVAALALSSDLVEAFSGKGLVPDHVVANPAYAISVALGAALTIALATRFGFPVSTTHALLGGLLGAGVLAAPRSIDLSQLGATFVAPLLLSPLLACAVVAGLCYASTRRRTLPTPGSNACLCVDSGVALRTSATSTLELDVRVPSVRMGTIASCEVVGASPLVAVNTRGATEAAQYFVGGLICFARALNDTPKIAALTTGVGLLSGRSSITVVAVLMALGGLLFSRRVAETMAHKVTSMSPTQGLASNFVTAALVLFASKVGLPVSTTHVACGSLFGIGMANRTADKAMIRSILAAWLSTLPCAAVLAAGAYMVLRLLA